MATAREIEDYANRLQERFEYTLLGGIFAALALSIQFSPGMGGHAPYLLFIAWGLFFISGIAGGWSLLYLSVAHRHMAVKASMEAWISTIAKNPHAMLVDEDTGEPLDKESNKQTRIKIKDKSQQKVDKLNKYFEITGHIERIGFVLALLCNVVFAGINYYLKI